MKRVGVVNILRNFPFANEIRIKPMKMFFKKISIITVRRTVDGCFIIFSPAVQASAFLFLFVHFLQL